jgi:glycosyltransferase involved in cell wall biosynthesis
MNLLLVSISAPPQNSPESLQVAKYVSGLAKLSRLTLVTIKEVGGWRSADKGLNEYLYGVKKIIRLNHYTSKLFRLFYRLFFTHLLRRPDEYFMFPTQWRTVTKKLTEKPDLIYSRATPFSSCLMALKLKAHYKVPWVMHLSDLWADSPHFKYNNADKNYLQQLEAKCFKIADRISMTSHETIDFYAKKYPKFAAKFFFTPNVYRDEELLPNPFRFDGKLKFLHAGNFYGKGRSPAKLIEAFTLLYNKNPQLLNEVEIHFLGKFNHDIRTIFTQNNLPFIKVTENYSFQDSISHQRNSHIMLLFDWQFEHMNSVFFLSKILGYMASQRFILAITGKGSTCYNVIEGKYGKCFEHDDIEGIMEFIINAIDNYKNQNLAFFKINKPDPAYAANYNVNLLYNRFVDMTTVSP